MPIVKLAYFSRARKLPLGATTTIHETWNYLPPEKPSISHRGDVWAVGEIVHWLALNAPPIDHREYATIHQGGDKSRRDSGRKYEQVRRIAYPINLSLQEWIKRFGSTKAHTKIAFAPVWTKTYSGELQTWMKQSLKFLPNSRNTAGGLVQDMTPVGTKKIKELRRPQPATNLSALSLVYKS
jgi:serine/threonine protein kinase